MNPRAAVDYKKSCLCNAYLKACTRQLLVDHRSCHLLLDREHHRDIDAWNLFMAFSSTRDRSTTAFQILSGTGNGIACSQAEQRYQYSNKSQFFHDLFSYVGLITNTNVIIRDYE